MRRYRQGHPEYRVKYYGNYNKDESRERIKKYRLSHPDYVEKWSNPKDRLELIEFLGTRCSNPKCAVSGGMTDIRALQLDHVNGGGNKDRKRFKSWGGMYAYYNKHKDEAKNALQVLCANCNWIKRI